MFFSTSFLILLTVTESTKVVLINMIAMWMMWTQLAPLGHLKIKVFWNKVHDAIISVHGVMRKDLSHDSNYFEDMAIWSKFENLRCVFGL